MSINSTPQSVARPGAIDVTARMLDSLLVALSDPIHQVHGHAASVAGLVGREYARSSTRLQAGEASPVTRLTPAGLRRAVTALAELPSNDPARRFALSSARENALRVLRMEDGSRSHRELSTVGPDGRPVPGGEPVQVSPTHAALKVTTWILAGAKAIRNDAAGTVVRVVHLSGAVTILRATVGQAAPPIGAQRALTGSRS
ncbi:hypothetical protein ACFRKE_24935 [Kitasatospora indigofera]|uniref:hypothetical protein n=1 Tax=Kitasatospora indigofera TaxID=67307 RepID=UPI0036A5AB12